jgi:hypothetical protein
MKEQQLRIQEVFDELFLTTTQEKVNYIESLLFNFTITGRGIWSDEHYNDTEKVNAFKWLNELSHRVFNMLYRLRQGNDADIINSLYNNLKYHSEQSDLLRRHLTPIILLTYKNGK